MAVLVQEAAARRLDEIYRYARETWGDEQAETYINGLFQAFDGIETRQVMSRPISAAFGVDGFFFRYQSHFVYWRRLIGGDIGIVTVLHQRLHQMAQLKNI